MGTEQTYLLPWCDNPHHVAGRDGENAVETVASSCTHCPGDREALFSHHQRKREWELFEELSPIGFVSASLESNQARKYTFSVPTSRFSQYSC